MSIPTNQDQEPGIETAGPYYAGWVSFTQWSTYGIVAVVVLLALMAVVLV